MVEALRCSDDEGCEDDYHHVGMEHPHYLTKRADPMMKRHVDEDDGTPLDTDQVKQCTEMELKFMGLHVDDPLAIGLKKAVLELFENLGKGRGEAGRASCGRE